MNPVTLQWQLKSDEKPKIPTHIKFFLMVINFFKHKLRAFLQLQSFCPVASKFQTETANFPSFPTLGLDWTECLGWWNMLTKHSQKRNSHVIFCVTSFQFLVNYWIHELVTLKNKKGNSLKSILKLYEKGRCQLPSSSTITQNKKVIYEQRAYLFL